MTVFGNVPFVSARQQNPGGNAVYSTNAFGDILLGARLGLVTVPLPISLEARLMFPSGKSAEALPTGSGDFRGELRLAFAKSFSFPLYFDVEFGVTLRGAGTVYDPISSTANHTVVNNYSPELVLHGEVGATLLRWRNMDRLLLAVAVDYRGSTTKEQPGSDATVSLYPANSELTTIGPRLMAFLYRGLGIAVAYTQAVEGLRVPVVSTVGGSIFVAY